MNHTAHSPTLTKGRILRVLLALTILAGLTTPLMRLTRAHAATGTLYLDQATDPHGAVWLGGTVDGSTTGAMSTDPTVGHLWTTDVPSGFCRVIPQVANPDGTVTAAFLDRNTTGGCIHPGQKAGDPYMDPRRNADGTFYVYTPDWAVFSQGVYRLTYDPGRQIMTNQELLAPGRYPTNNKPFSTAFGLGDHKLYVSNDKDGAIARFTNPNGQTALQTVEAVGTDNDNTRVRAITFVCWSNMAGLSLNGIAGSRNPGEPGCTASDPAPDLLIEQKTKISVMLNAETCQADAGGCPAWNTPIKVLTPMGARTDPSNPDVVWVTDAPGATAQVIRYTISTNVQDSYSNFGTLPDGSTVQYSFAFSVAFGPDRTMYIGDDPCAGASAFCGHLWTVAPNAPADALGQPGLPPAPPPPPSLANGALWGTGVTIPNDGIWLGAHLWIADSVNGLCRMDANPATGLTAENAGSCVNGGNSPLKKPGQSVEDPTAQPDGTHFVYVSDDASKSSGVIRYKFDQAGTVCTTPAGALMGPDSLCNPVIEASGLVGTGFGLDNQRADAVALDPNTGALYVGFRLRNLTATTQIARVNRPDVDPSLGGQTVDFIAPTTRQKPVFGLGFIQETVPAGAPKFADLYVGNNGGVDWLPNPSACATGQCRTLQLLNVRGPRGFATDGVNTIYMAAPPAPGSASSNTTVTRYTVSNGDLFTYSSVGLNPDGSQQPYGFVDSLALDPSGNLYVGDDPTFLGSPAGAGHVWKVAANQTGPSQPTITAKPGSPTNNTLPSFVFSTLTPGATFRCSLQVETTAGVVPPDSYAPCASPFSPASPLADGTWVFKVEAIDPATGNTSIPSIYFFVVDTVAPVVTITKAPASPSNVNAPQFTFTSSKANVSFQCSFSTGADAFTSCGSPQQYPTMPDGVYAFKVFATDTAGNVSAVQSSALTIDTTPPVITASPAGGAYPTAQSVTLAANEPATIYYTTDGSAPTTASTVYAGPINVAATTPLKYIGVDLAGNQSAVATQQYTIGTVSLDQKPLSLGNNNTPTFAFSAPGVTGATFQCSLVASGAPDAFAACTSPLTYPAQGDGAYTFKVQGFDPTGASLGTVAYNFTIDTVAPVVTLTQNPPNPSPSATETFAFSSSKAGTALQCSFVAQGTPDNFVACASPQSYAAADGFYAFKVRGTDPAGNTSATTQYLFQVAASSTPIATAPKQTLGTGGTAATTGVPVTLNWSASACANGAAGCNIASYALQESVNGGPFVNVALPSATATSLVVNLTPSPINQSAVTTYQFEVRATSTTGAVSPFAVGSKFTVPSQDQTTGMSFSGSWSGANLSAAFGGSVQFSSSANAFAQNSNPLVGASSLAFVSTMGPDRGLARITVDGGAPTTVDLYSATPKVANVVWSANGLDSTVGHTIKVTVLGQKNAASTGTRVDIDAYLALK